MSKEKKRKQKVIVIVGPTSSGKSDLAVEIAREFDGEVISADSRQVYKGLDIGTGKITKREMRGVPHYLLDVISPKKVFTAYDFAKCGREAIADILSRGKLPIIAGGTGFYIDALLGNVELPNVPADENLRAKLEAKTAKQLFEKLKKIDPMRAKKLEKIGESEHKRRLIRAIEIAQSIYPNGNGRAPKARTHIMSKGYPCSSYDVLWIGIKVEDKILRERIYTRLITRLKKGMVAEVRNLHKKGLTWKRMENLGLEYRYLSRFLRGKITKEEMINTLSTKIWQYARRQKAYWRRNTKIQWISLQKNKCTCKELVQKFLQG